VSDLSNGNYLGGAPQLSTWINIAGVNLKFSDQQPERENDRATELNKLKRYQRLTRPA
jgi:hypothetical protein